jgi:hypothetical protein
MRGGEVIVCYSRGLDPGIQRIGDLAAALRRVVLSTDGYAQSLSPKVTGDEKSTQRVAARIDPLFGIVRHGPSDSKQWWTTAVSRVLACNG